jgi:hypothetical protein
VQHAKVRNVLCPVQWNAAIIDLCQVLMICLFKKGLSHYACKVDKGLFDADMAPVLITEKGTSCRCVGCICDGVAASIIVTSKEAVRDTIYNLLLDLLIMSKITGYNPAVMGIGLVSSLQQALQLSDNMRLEEMDRLEIH